VFLITIYISQNSNNSQKIQLCVLSPAYIQLHPTADITECHKIASSTFGRLSHSRHISSRRCPQRMSGRGGVNRRDIDTLLQSPTYVQLSIVTKISLSELKFRIFCGQKEATVCQSETELPNSSVQQQCCKSTMRMRS